MEHVLLIKTCTNVYPTHSVKRSYNRSDLEQFKFFIPHNQNKTNNSLFELGLKKLNNRS